MLINSSFKRFIFFATFVLLLPLIQKQWLNLYLFNQDNFAFYSNLYYISGLIFPIAAIYYSINKFTYYKFNQNTNSATLGALVLMLVKLMVKMENRGRTGPCILTLTSILRTFCSVIILERFKTII